LNPNPHSPLIPGEHHRDNFSTVYYDNIIDSKPHRPYDLQETIVSRTINLNYYNIVMVDI